MVPEAARRRARRGGREVARRHTRNRAPDPLYELLVEHKVTQEEEREYAGSEWHKGDWMFAQVNGKPISPEQDRREWKQLLVDAGVREARLHDARHTAATVLLVLGVPERAVMGFMGWSSSSMTTRYQHITEALRRGIADRIGGFLWTPTETKGETGSITDSDKPS